MDRRRYVLTEFSTGSGDPCAHKALIPGLDASLCPQCKFVWNSPWKIPNEPTPTLETQSLPIMQTQQSHTQTTVRTVPRKNADASKVPAKIPDFDYAITLHRPWPYAIAHMGKDIENRTWKAHLKPGDWLAIHAGRSYDFSAEDWLRDRFPNHALPEIEKHETGIIAIAQFLGNVTKSESVWFGGPVGWELGGEVMALIDPVECAGKQGLWKPSETIKQQVYEELKVPF